MEIIKVLFIFLFILVPSINLFFGASLSNTHLLFYLFSLILTFGKTKDFFQFLKYLKNFKKIEIGNIKLEQQVNSLNEMKSLNPIKNVEQKQDNINDKYIQELLFSKLKFNYNLINERIREIYSLLYNDNVSNVDNILIFDYLRQNEILNESFCYYVYAYCTLVNDFFNIADFEDFSKINDLLNIGDDILAKLNYVKNYITDNVVRKNQTV